MLHGYYIGSSGCMDSSTTAELANHDLYHSQLQAREASSLRPSHPHDQPGLGPRLARASTEGTCLWLVGGRGTWLARSVGWCCIKLGHPADVMQPAGLGRRDHSSSCLGMGDAGFSSSPLLPLSRGGHRDCAVCSEEYRDIITKDTYMGLRMVLM